MEANRWLKWCPLQQEATYSASFLFDSLKKFEKVGDCAGDADQ
jgi:hypothetical protein